MWDTLYEDLRAFLRILPAFLDNHLANREKFQTNEIKLKIKQAFHARYTTSGCLTVFEKIKTKRCHPYVSELVRSTTNSYWERTRK
jgi:hypothetical protein